MERLLREVSVPIVGRLATMTAVMIELSRYSPSGDGVLNQANVFFVDGNISPSSSNGRDGNGILAAFAEKGIAYPATFVADHRDRYPERLNGIAFGCSRDVGDAGFARSVDGFNLYPNAPDAQRELARMLDIAVELLPVAT
jgi:hypothetical protein